MQITMQRFLGVVRATTAAHRTPLRLVRMYSGPGGGSREIQEVDLEVAIEYHAFVTRMEDRRRTYVQYEEATQWAHFTAHGPAGYQRCILWPSAESLLSTEPPRETAAAADSMDAGSLTPGDLHRPVDDNPAHGQA